MYLLDYHIYKYIYVPEGLQKKKENLIKKLKNGKLLPGVYLITLASTDQNQLDIFPACIRRQKNYPEELPLVVGLTKDFEDALEIVEGITQEVYNETKGADIRSYILEKEREG